MTGVALYGIALAAAGLLAAGAAAARDAERVRVRLGPPPWRRRRRIPRRRRGRLAARAAARGWPYGPGSYAAALAGMGLLGAAVGFRVAGPVAGAVGLVVAPLGLEGVLGRQRDARRVALEEELREWIRALAAGARAGLSLRRALGESSGDAGPPLRPFLDRAGAWLAAGAPIDQVLDDLAMELGAQEARLLATVLSVHRRTGGDLASLLDDVAETVARRLESRRELRALTAQGRASGAVLAVLPVAFVGLLSGMGGNGLGAFYRTPSGSALLALGLALQGVGFLWIRRIVGRAG